MQPSAIRRIDIERPANFDRQADAGKAFDRYAAAVISAAQLRGLEARVIDIPGKAFFAPRIAEPGAVLFSFHSAGFSPNVFRIKESYIRPHYYFDRLGFGGFSEVAVSTHLQQRISAPSAEADRFAADFRSSFVASRVSKYAQDASPLPDFGRFVFAPLQVDSDVVAMLANFDTAGWLKALDRVARETGLAVVAKRHPKCRSDVIGRFIAENKNPKLVFTTASVFDLMEKAVAVLAINSGVGFEALVMDKTVITGGRSDYAFLTHQCSKAEDILECFNKVMPASRREVNAFLHHHLTESTFKIGDPVDAARVVAKALEPSAWDITEDVEWRGAEFGLAYFAFHQKMMDLASTGNSKFLGRLKTWGLSRLARRYAKSK